MDKHETQIVEQTRQDEESKTDEPPMFRVVLYNDDFTPKVFVVELLVSLFHKSFAEATELMWRIHHGQRGVAGVYPREIAETKITVASVMARENGFPLKLTLEEDR